MITSLKIKKKYNCNHTYLKHEELQKIRTIFASKIKLVFSLVIKGHLVIFCYNLVSSLPILLAAFFWVQIKKINLSFLRIYRPRVRLCAIPPSVPSIRRSDETKRTPKASFVSISFLRYFRIQFARCGSLMWKGSTEGFYSGKILDHLHSKWHATPTMKKKCRR